MENDKEKREVVIDWFLKHSCEEFPIYDRGADELLKNLEQVKDKKTDANTTAMN